MKARTIAMAAVVMLLAGCDAMPPQTAAARPARSGFAVAEGKSFYLFHKGYVCGGAVPGGPAIPSWVDRIEVHNGAPVRWGSRCGGEGLPLPADERATARLSSDGTQLIVADKIYRLSADPRREAEMQP